MHSVLISGNRPLNRHVHVYPFGMIMLIWEINKDFLTSIKRPEWTMLPHAKLHLRVLSFHLYSGRN
jgi:hypothetical protein